MILRYLDNYDDLVEGLGKLMGRKINFVHYPSTDQIKSFSHSKTWKGRNRKNSALYFRNKSLQANYKGLINSLAKSMAEFSSKQLLAVLKVAPLTSI